MRLPHLRIAVSALLLLLPTAAMARSAEDRAFLDRMVDAVEVEPAPAGDDYTTFEACDSIVENTTDKEVTITITICNSDPSDEMIVDIGGKEVTRIPAGKCKTIIVKIPPGGSLHADENGKYKLGPTPATSTPATR